MEERVAKFFTSISIKERDVRNISARNLQATSLGRIYGRLKRTPRIDFFIDLILQGGLNSLFCSNPASAFFIPADAVSVPAEIIADEWTASPKGQRESDRPIVFAQWRAPLRGHYTSRNIRYKLPLAITVIFIRRSAFSRKTPPRVSCGRRTLYLRCAPSSLAAANLSI